MLQLSQLQEISKHGPSLIVVGMAVVLTALLWPGVPIAAAVMLIGSGAMLTIFARPSRQELLGLISLAIYASLGCLAVAAQTHAGLNSPAERVGSMVLLDHCLATALLALMIRSTIRRLQQFST